MITSTFILSLTHTHVEGYDLYTHSQMHTPDYSARCSLAT